MPAKSRRLDFTHVKERKFTKRHVPAGDYLARVTDVEDAKSKDEGKPMWLFTIELVNKSGATYPYYCRLDGDQLWKVKGLLSCSGLKVPKKLIQVDPNKAIGRDIGVSLDDTEYNGRMQSEISSIIPPSDVDEGSDKEASEDEEEEEEEEESSDDEDEEEEEEEEKPKAKKSKKSKKTAPDDDELEELEVEEI